MRIIVTVLIFANLSRLGESILAFGEPPFCDLKWPRCGLTIPNIVCQRGLTCAPEPGCENLERDPEFLRWILHEHNRLRNEIATGKETRGFNEPAANMNALSYDKDLEYTAACNANRCKFEHDKCRSTTKFNPAGQNLFYATGNESVLRNAVQEWFEEIKLNTQDVIDKFPRGHSKIERFSQMIWAKTTHIGCAAARKISTNEYFLVCNYGPKGNEPSKRVYEKGPGCSRCPFLTTCNRDYPGLCGKVDESALGDGKEKDPVDVASDKNGNAEANVPEVRVSGFGVTGFGGLGLEIGSGDGENKTETARTTNLQGTTQSYEVTTTEKSTGDSRQTNSAVTSHSSTVQPSITTRKNDTTTDSTSSDSRNSDSTNSDSTNSDSIDSDTTNSDSTISGSKISGSTISGSTTSGSTTSDSNSFDSKNSGSTISGSTTSGSTTSDSNSFDSKDSDSTISVSTTTATTTTAQETSDSTTTQSTTKFITTEATSTTTRLPPSRGNKNRFLTTSEPSSGNLISSYGSFVLSIVCVGFCLCYCF